MRAGAIGGDPDAGSTEPAVYGAVPLVVVAVGVIARYIPARRTSRITPWRRYRSTKGVRARRRSQLDSTRNR